MIKTMTLLLAAFIALPAMAQTQPNSCVIQQTQVTKTSTQADFVMACDGIGLSTAKVAPLSVLSTEDAAQVKAAYVQTVKELVGGETAKCQQWEQAGVFFVVVCTR